MSARSPVSSLDSGGSQASCGRFPAFIASIRSGVHTVLSVVDPREGGSVHGEAPRNRVERYAEDALLSRGDGLGGMVAMMNMPVERGEGTRG